MMKMGSVNMAVATAMTVMVMIGSLLHGAEAQGVDCLSNGAGAPFDDATTVVQQLRVKPGQCCQSSSGFCTVLLESGNAAATICGPTGFCPNCADVGNHLNEVLAQCNQLGEVVGAFSPDGTSSQLFYLTSASNHP